jgi:hypothetical protein
VTELDNGAQSLSASAMLIQRLQKPSMIWHLGWVGSYSCFDIIGVTMVQRQCQGAERWPHKGDNYQIVATIACIGGPSGRPFSAKQLEEPPNLMPK